MALIEPDDLDDLPLAVDLDGTLIRADVLNLGWRAAWRRRPLSAALALGRLLGGRAPFKAAIARLSPLAPSALPFHPEMLAALRAERARGRKIVLATAADHAPADAIAKHLGLFDAVLASDGRRNLKGAQKADILAHVFPQGFVYAGDSYADLQVWRRAAGAWVVAARPGLVAAARRCGPVLRVFDA